MALHRSASFADRPVKWQIGITSITALRGAVFDDWGDYYRARALRYGRSTVDFCMSQGAGFAPEAFVRQLLSLPLSSAGCESWDVR